jgi:hypothetical protein
MRIFVLTTTYELRVSRKSHLRDHPRGDLRPELRSDDICQKRPPHTYEKIENTVYAMPRKKYLHIFLQTIVKGRNISVVS